MTTSQIAAPSTNGTPHVPKAEPVRKRIPRWTLLAGGLIVVLVIAAIVAWRMLAPAPVALVTTPVQLGTLVRTVTASGTVNPQNTISIGSQISGTISEVDVDYNSVVKTGQVLVRIDPTNFQTALDQAQAQLAQTQANARQAAATAVGANAGIAVQSATATAAADAIAGDAANVVKAQGALVLAQQTIARDTSLLNQGFVAQNAVDADQAALEAAASGVASAQATLTQARSQYLASNAQNTVAGAQAQASAGTAQAQSAAIGIQAAQVKTAQYNLAHTTITSPVNGTVISRNVAIGETVASSFSTPVLFTIAQDLSKMEVDLAVGEPDIGSVKAGATVTFTVLAFPTTTFTGIVSQVRQNPTVVSNVVTYDTVVVVNNKNGLLRPGMTANALIQTQKAANALIVPLQALEYRPSAAVIAKYNLKSSYGLAAPHPRGAAGTVGTAAGSQFGATMGAGATKLPSGTRGRVFVLRSGAMVAVPVQIVLTAATQAAVKPVTGTLAAGDALVTADTSTAAQPRTSAATQTAPGFGQSPQGGGAARAVR